MPLVPGAEARPQARRHRRGPRGTPQMQHTRIAHQPTLARAHKQLPDSSKSQLCLFPGLAASGAPANRREPARDILPLQGAGMGPNMVPGE